MKTHAFKSIVLCLLAACLSLPASGVIYVDADASPGGDGSSWANAFDTIQEAIDAASMYWIICTGPTSIYVKQGTYSLTSQIEVDKVVSLYGGFPSSIAEPTIADRDWQAYPTTIDGNNNVRCLYVTSHCNIDGFYIRDGYTTGSGGGIYFKSRPYECTGFPSNYWISGSIRNCDFYSNDAASGGAIYLPTTIDGTTGSDADIENCTFLYNTADTGGAIYMLYSAPDIERCTFHHNQSLAPGSLGGGAIAGFSHNYTTNQWVSISNCLFYLNTSGSWGGAYSGNQTYPTITNCTFADNEADIAGGAFHGNTNSEGIHMFNSICWGNSPDQLDLTMSSTFLNISYSDIQGGWAGPGSNNINVDPDFQSDYSLMPGSDCIDAGSNGYAPSDDILGNPRPLDGDDDGTATADMGAFEMEYTNVDLRVTGVTIDPAIPIVNQPVTIQVTVRNYGTTDSGSFWLDWYANEASAPGATIGDRYWRLALPASTSVTKETTYTYTGIGDISMYAQADTNNEVLESDETNNVYGPRNNRVVDGTPLDFAIRADESNASRYFGGDDSPIRNVGVGQTITPVRTARVARAGFHFKDPFDYASFPDGTGHDVTLIMRVRRVSDGLQVGAVGMNLRAAFSGGWVMFPFSNLWLEAGEQYAFLCYLVDGEYTALHNSVSANSGNPWPTETGYTSTVYGQPADMVSWANWTTHSWDFNFRMEGQYIEPYPGDFNDDRSVSLPDAASLAGYWLADDCLMPGWCDRCDVNWDSHVQLLDFNILSRYWGNTYYGYDDLNRAAIASLESEMSGAVIDASDGNEFNPGTYIIYKTTAGRFGKFMVENFDKADSNKLTLAWVTYNADGTVWSSGSGLVIEGTHYCGLDTGMQTVTSDTGSEFWWRQMTSSTRRLSPLNGAIFKLMYREP